MVRSYSALNDMFYMTTKNKFRKQKISYPKMGKDYFFVIRGKIMDMPFKVPYELVTKIFI